MSRQDAHFLGDRNRILLAVRILILDHRSELFQTRRSYLTAHCVPRCRGRWKTDLKATEGESFAEEKILHDFQDHLPLWDSLSHPRLWVSSWRVSFVPGHVMAELSLESHWFLARLKSFLKIILLEPDCIWEFIPFITNRWTETQIKGPVGLFFRATV